MGVSPCCMWPVVAALAVLIPVSSDDNNSQSMVGKLYRLSNGNRPPVKPIKSIRLDPVRQFTRTANARYENYLPWIKSQLNDCVFERNPDAKIPTSRTPVGFVVCYF